MTLTQQSALPQQELHCAPHTSLKLLCLSKAGKTTQFGTRTSVSLANSSHGQQVVRLELYLGILRRARMGGRIPPAAALAQLLPHSWVTPARALHWQDCTWARRVPHHFKHVPVPSSTLRQYKLISVELMVKRCISDFI